MPKPSPDAPIHIDFSLVESVLVTALHADKMLADDVGRLAVLACQIDSPLLRNF